MKRIICLHPEVKAELARNLILFVLWEAEHGGYVSDIIMSEAHRIQAKKREAALLEELKTRASALENKHKQLRA